MLNINKIIPNYEQNKLNKIYFGTFTIFISYLLQEPNILLIFIIFAIMDIKTIT